MKKIRKTTLLLLLISILTLTSTGCSNKSNQEEEIVKKQVKVQEIKFQDEVTTKLTASSTIVPKQYSVIKSLTQGTMDYVPPAGINVKVGDPLFQIRDDNIENNYFNNLQKFRQTNILVSQRVTQAELSLNNAQAQLNLAEKNLKTTESQTQQNLTNAQNSAVLTYNSAYNSLSQFLKYISVGNIDNYEFRYKDITTTQTQLFYNTQAKYLTTAEKFIALAAAPNRADLNQSLNEIYNVLFENKILVDSLVILMQNTLGGVENIEGEKSVLINYQTQINTYTEAIVATQNGLRNTILSNELAIEQAKNQLETTQIQLDNAIIGLENTKQSGELEQNVAQSQLDNASYNYNNLFLASPFSGTILSVAVEAGQQVSAGQTILELGNLSIVEIELSIDTEFAKNLKQGDKVKINEIYDGLITEIEPVGNISSGKISVKVQAENQEENLIAGDIADVTFNLVYQQPELIIIPIKSATIEQSQNYVFVVQDGKAVKQPVTLGKIFGDKVSVESGLEQGQKVILKNGVFISDGEQVEIID